MTQEPLPLDVLIFGGGIAGLWTLDELRRKGYRVVLLEAHGLGSSQSIACQGIIHGGLKYMFDGNLTASARIIANMPPLWRDCLAGRSQPDLSATTVLADGSCIWGTGSIMSRLFLTGSTFALRTVPKPLDRSQWPTPLARVPGKVLHVGEQVIDPSTLMRTLATRNAGHCLHIDPDTVEFRRTTQGTIDSVRISPNPKSSTPAQPLELCPAIILLTAGEGNEDLRHRAGLSESAMQRRPLHMVMARGALPRLFGHCVGGPKPRLTITSAVDSAGRYVWQIGGQIAEEGVHKDPPQLIDFARRELLTCIPGLDLAGIEFTTYRVNRAEAATSGGHRPDDVQLIRDSNLITAWPTKLALAPRLAERLLEMLPAPTHAGPLPQIDFPAPPVAPLPWEAPQQWIRA